MTNDTPSLLLRHIRRLASGEDPRSDRELLERFAAGAGDEAFAELVRRHGPMVLRVCRRLLAEPADAEDAFQATFLVLARKAAVVRWRDSVAGWLFGVARNVACRTRDAAARRAAHERRIAIPIVVEPVEEVTARELFAVLEEELGRLPEKERAALVLCYLEGLTRDEAARRLGCPVGTLKDRLERGKRRLRTALARRGVALPAGLVVLLAAEAAEAALPAALAEAAVRAALSGGGSVMAAVLARSVLRPPLTAALRLSSVLVLAAGAVAGGIGLFLQRPVGGEPPASPAAAQAAGPRTDLYGDPLPDGAVARLGSVRLRHAGLSHYVFRDDGKTIVSIGTDRMLRSWDIATGKQVGAVPLEGTARFHWAVLSDDGKTVAARDGSNLVLWEADTGKQIKTLPAPKGDISSLFFSPDGKELIATTWQFEATLWDWRKGESRRIALPARKTSQDSSFHAHVSPDGRWLVAGGGWEDPLTVFDRTTGREVRRFRCNSLTSTVSADGKTLAVCDRQGEGKDMEFVLWFFDLDAGKETARFSLGKESSYLSLAFSPDGKSLACGFSDHSFVTDCATGRKKFALPGRPISLGFSPDGKTLAASTGHRLRLWDATTGKERLDLPGEFGFTLALAVSPDGRLLAAADWLDRSVSLWETTGRLRGLLPLKGEGRYVRDLVFSPDGRTLWAAQYKGFLQSWDIATAKEKGTVQLQDPTRTNPDFTYFFHLHMSSDARRVFSLERMFIPKEFTRLAAWDATTGKLLQQHSLPPQSRACAWIAEGSVALTLDDGLRLMGVETGAVRFRVAGTLAGSPPAASPDGRLLAARRKEGVGVWEAATGKEVASAAVGAAAHLALTPDGRFLVATDERALHVWDLAAGKERRRWPLPLTGTDGWGGTFVSGLVLTPDGRRAVTALADGTALVWDLSGALAPVVSPAPAEEDVSRWWSDLAGEDAARGYAAVWRLTECPAAAVRLLRRQLHPVADTDLAEVRRLVAQLDDDTFAVRQKAFGRLEALGETAVPALRQALTKAPPPEVRRRIEELLEKHRGTLPSGDHLRLLRALAVLEHAGTPEARRLLEELARGVPDAPQTQEARAVLARLVRWSVRNSALLVQP